MKRQGSAGPIVIQQQRAKGPVGEQPSEEVLRGPTVAVRSGHQPRGRGPAGKEDTDAGEHHENAANDDPHDSYDGVGARFVMCHNLANDFFVAQGGIGLRQGQRGLFSPDRRGHRMF